MQTLNVDTVKAFVLIADLRSFTRAAEALGATQSALSVKLKRLEKKLDQRLIERTSRQVRLSAYGELFIKSARVFITAHDQAVSTLPSLRSKLRLGISCHVMGPEVPHILSRLKQLYPSLNIEIKQDNSGILLDDFNKGLLDIIIIRSEDDSRYGTVLCSEHFGWYCSQNFKYNREKPLHLASLSPLCGVHNLSTRALEQAGISWTEAFVANDTQLFISAISAGLAVGVFPRRTAPKELIEISDKLGLPSLQSSSIIAHTSLSDKYSKKIINTISSVFKELN